MFSIYKNFFKSVEQRLCYEEFKRVANVGRSWSLLKVLFWKLSPLIGCCIRVAWHLEPTIASSHVLNSDTKPRAAALEACSCVHDGCSLIQHPLMLWNMADSTAAVLAFTRLQLTLPQKQRLLLANVTVQLPVVRTLAVVLMTCICATFCS